MKKFDNSNAKKKLDLNLEKVLKNDSIAVMGAPSQTPNDDEEKSNKIIKLAPVSIFLRILARFIDILIISAIALILQLGLIMAYSSTLTAEYSQKIIDNCLYTEIQNSTQECADFVKDVSRYIDAGLIIILAINIVYFVLMPITKLQGTFGKRILKLYIVNIEGLNKINILQSITREVFWIFSSAATVLTLIFKNNSFNTISDIAFILILVSLTYINFNKYKQAWHDKLASTIVVKMLNKNTTK